MSSDGRDLEQRIRGVTGPVRGMPSAPASIVVTIRHHYHEVVCWEKESMPAVKCVNTVFASL